MLYNLALLSQKNEQNLKNYDLAASKYSWFDIPTRMASVLLCCQLSKLFGMEQIGGQGPSKSALKFGAS